MVPPELPSPVPPDARRPFARPDVFERLSRQLEVTEGSRILEVGAGRWSAALHLSRELGCDAVVAAFEPPTVEALKREAKSEVPDGRLDVQELPFAKLPFRDHEFDAIIVSERHAAPFAQLVQTLRPMLVERGRLCITYPVKVGRFPLSAAVEAWEKWLGEPLVYPKDLMQVLTQQGLEVKWVETMSDLELDELYRAAEPSDELNLHRSQGGRASVTFALVMARRKEPGERLPTTRDRG